MFTVPVRIPLSDDARDRRDRALDLSSDARTVSEAAAQLTVDVRAAFDEWAKAEAADPPRDGWPPVDGLFAGRAPRWSQ